MRGCCGGPRVGAVKSRRLLALVPALFAVAVWPTAAEAGNIAWVGITGPSALQEAFSGECMGVSPRLTNTRETVGQIGPPENVFEVRDDGTIKAWTALGYVQAAANNPPADPPDATMRFDLLRPFASKHPTKIAESQAAAFLDGKTPNPYSQAVEAGDGIGVDLEANPGNEESQAWIGCTAGSETTFGHNNAVWSPPLVSGNPAGEPEEGSPDPDYLLELGAEVEYDAPVITGISQSSGALEGEDKVTITGAHLKYDSVHIGENDAGKYEDTDTKSVIRIPAGRAEGPVDVIVKTAGGTATLTDGYTYVHVPGEETGGGGGSGPTPEEECEEAEEEGEPCEEPGTDGGGGAGGSGGGGSGEFGNGSGSGGSGGSGGGGGSSPSPSPETPSKPNPGPLPGPAPHPGKSGAGPTSFKLPKIKVAKAGGALSLAPDAPAAGVFHVDGVIVIPGDPHASHTRSVVYGSAVAHAKGAGPLSIKLAPSAAAKHLLAGGHPVKVHLTITFTAASAGKSTQTTVVTVRDG